MCKIIFGNRLLLVAVMQMRTMAGALLDVPLISPKVFPAEIYIVLCFVDVANVIPVITLP